MKDISSASLEVRCFATGNNNVQKEVEPISKFLFINKETIISYAFLTHAYARARSPNRFNIVVLIVGRHT